jgi:hypothetical protein
MTQWTAVIGSQRFRWQTFLLLNMGLEIFLMDCFFTTRTLLIVLAIGTLPNKVGCKVTDLDALPTLATDKDHRAGIEVMHVFIVLFHKTFINSLAELADLVFVYNVFVSIGCLFGNLYKLISSIEILLLSMLSLPASLR